MKEKGKILSSLKKLFSDFKEGDIAKKSEIIALLAMFANYALAAGKFLIGFILPSFFLTASGVYSLGMGASRQVYINACKRAKKDRDKHVWYIWIATLLLISGVLYGIYMLRFILTDYNLNLGLIPAIAVAAVSFTELIISIVSMVKSFKHHDILFRAVAIINLLTSFAAIALTQICLLAAQIHEDIRLVNMYNGIFGLGVAVITILISVFMIIKAKVRIKKCEVEKLDFTSSDKI